MNKTVLWNNSTANCRLGMVIGKKPSESLIRDVIYFEHKVDIYLLSVILLSVNK